VPHNLTVKNRISIYESLQKRNEIELFLKQLITGGKMDHVRQ